MHLWWENKVEYICTKGKAVLSHNLDGRAYCTALTGLLSNCSPWLSCWFKFSQSVCCSGGMESTSFSDEDLSLLKPLPFHQLKITLKWLFTNRDTELSCIRAITDGIIPRNSFRKGLWGEKLFSCFSYFPFFSFFMQPLSTYLTRLEPFALPGLETWPLQRPRPQQRQNRAHKVLWHSLPGCFLESEDIPASSTASGPDSAQG